MREVPMPTGFAAHCCRRAIALIAAWLVVLQAVLAGMAIAQAAAAWTADPLAAAAICHGSGSAGSEQQPAPETGKVRHLCCAYCMSAAPALASPWCARTRPCAPADPRRLQRSHERLSRAGERFARRSCPYPGDPKVFRELVLGAAGVVAAIGAASAHVTLETKEAPV